MMYEYTTWYVNREGRGQIYDTTQDFIRSELLKRECYRLHGNSHNKIKIVENDGQETDSTSVETMGCA